MRSLLGIVAPTRFSPSPKLSKDSNMKAVVMYKHGLPDVLQYKTDFPSPIPIENSNQIICSVMGAGLNPVDFKMRKGPIWDQIYPKPKIIGSDFSFILFLAIVI
jgi:NADPH:quinone reductase-like Zn-dependent oxidoreductase